jgi:hypothetical protein
MLFASLRIIKPQQDCCCMPTTIVTLSLACYLSHQQSVNLKLKVGVISIKCSVYRFHPKFSRLAHFSNLILKVGLF